MQTNDNEIFEIWKDVSGYEPYFQISNMGRVYSKRSGRILKTSMNNGYPILSSKIGGRQGQNVCFKIHRLVAEAFIDNPENKPYVNHINGVKVDNRYSNLEWCTSQENIKHAYNTGLNESRKGELNHYSTLTNDEVIIIRRRFIRGCRENGIRAISRDYGVSHSTIAKVVNGKSYIL